MRDLGSLIATAVVFAGAGVAWTPRSACASGLDAPQVGSMGNNPLTVDAAAVHWNPGQLGFLDRGSLDFGFGLIGGHVGYQRQRRGAYQYEDNLDFSEPVDPEDIDPSKTSTADPVAVNPVGAVVDVFVGLPVVRDRLTVGAGLYVPYAAVLDFPALGPQRFAAQAISFAAAHATLSVGLRLHDKIAVGGGVSYVLSFLELTRVQDFGAVDLLGDALASPPIGQENDFGVDAPSTVRELDVMARPVAIERAISHSASFNLGIALRPSERLSLALVYQHGSRLRFRGDFQLDMDDDFFTQDLASQGLEYPALVRGDAEIELSLPKRMTLGMGYRWGPKFRLDGWLSYATYQDIDVIEIELSSPDLAQPELGVGSTVPQPLVRDWRGTVAVELAPRITVSPRLGLNVLLGYHSPASPDATVDVASPDGHRAVFGGGIDLRLTRNFSMLLDVEGQAIAPRRVSTSDFDLGNGRYTLVLGQLGLHGRLRFGPEHAQAG